MVFQIVFPEITTCTSVSFRRYGIMAAIVGPITMEEALRLGSSDLRYTLSRNDVRDDLQANFFEHEITTVSKFSSFFRDEADLVNVLRDDFNLDAAASLASRAQVASVICAWKDTQTKAKRQSEVEAEMDTREWTKPIPTGDYIQLRTAFFNRFGVVEDKVVPAKEYLEKKLQELENGEFRAETLSEVVGKDEIDPDVLTPMFGLERESFSEKGFLISATSNWAGTTSSTSQYHAKLFDDVGNQACYI